MKFESPFIGALIEKQDYIRLLERLKEYLQLPLEMDIDLTVYKNFPVAKLGDIYLNFLHEKFFKEVEGKWNSRKGRVNLNNLLVEMRLDSDEEMAERFNKLPYERKVGFTSVPMGLESTLYLPEYHVEKKRRSPRMDYKIYDCVDFWEYILSDDMMRNIALFSLMNGNVSNMRRRKIGIY